MERSRKSNKVTWASGTQLCQVQLFRRNDHPSQVVYQPQNRQGLKRRSSSSSQSMQCDSIVPPGFENHHYVGKLKEDSSNICSVKWKCPPKFILNSNWLVASGEESEEIELQKRREMTVMKRVDPYPSAVPLCSSISLDKGNELYDDSQTPIVPLIPIEDREYMEIENLSSTPIAQTNVAVNPQTQTTLNTSEFEFNAEKKDSFEGNLTIDASLAFTALTKVKEVEHSIDKELLIKILCDRNMVEKLINDDVAAAKKLIIGDNATVKDKSVYVSSTHTSVYAPKSAPTSKPELEVATNEVRPNIILSQPVPVSFPSTNLKPKPVVSTHLPSNGAYCASDNVQPKVTTKPSLPTIPLPELRRADSSFTFLPVLKPNTVLPPPPPSPNGNLHKMPNPMQVASSFMPSRPNSLLNARSVHSNPISNFQPAHFNPNSNSQPNTISNHHSAHSSSLPAHPNAFSKHHSNPALKFQPVQSNHFINSQHSKQNIVPDLQSAKPNHNSNIQHAQPNHNSNIQSTHSSPISNVPPSQLHSGSTFPHPRPIHGPKFQLPQPFLGHVSQTICNALPRPPNSFPVPTIVDGDKPSKDNNYLKNLIKEHGGIRQGLALHHNISNAGSFNDYNPNTNRSQKLSPEVELKKKFPKYCVYFKTPKGCRNGPYCRYRHDLPSSS